MVSCCGIATALIVVLLAIPLHFTLNPAKQFSVEGQCAVVTGASGGIGVVIANSLAEAGAAQLVLAARSADKLEKVAAELRSKHPKVTITVVPTDVTDDAARKNLREKAVEAFGDCSIILVNNAGVEAWQHYDGPQMAKWIDRTIDINVKGLMHLSREFLPVMMAANQGHIVNIASLAGKIGGAFVNAYAASKHAVVGFSRALRAEMVLMDKKVTVGVVCPGFILETGMAHDAMAGKEGWEETLEMYGKSYPIDSANAVLRAVEYNEPEQLVNGYSPIRFIVVMNEIFPRFPDWMAVITPPKVNTFLKALAARYD